MSVYTCLSARRGLWLPLGLKLQMVMRHYVVLEIKPTFSRKAASSRTAEPSLQSLSHKFEKNQNDVSVEKGL